jgi:hypothetical protein
MFKQLRSQILLEEKPESVKKFLDSLGDTMFTGALGPFKFAISKSLLTKLGYDPEEFCL